MKRLAAQHLFSAHGSCTSENEENHLGRLLQRGETLHVSARLYFMERIDKGRGRIPSAQHRALYGCVHSMVYAYSTVLGYQGRRGEEIGLT